MKVVEDWSKAVDSNHEVAIVFFDVQKAFDTVPHINLLKHLQPLKINKYILQWVKSYLMNRQQFVAVEGSESSCLHVLSGVPQGSVLGPLLIMM